MPSTLRTSFAFGLLIALLGCATRPHPIGNGRGKLHLMMDRDIAAVLLARCDAGLELTRAIALLKVGDEIAMLANTVRQHEESDRAAVEAWITRQSANPSIVGTMHETEIRTDHSAVIDQLRQTAASELDDHVLRVLISHDNEELEFIGSTPVKDKQLRKIVEEIWRRLTLEVKELSRPLPG